MCFKFKQILRDLEEIAASGFMQTPNDSFHHMQDCWKKEIAEVLHELRLKEKVCLFRHLNNNLLTNPPTAARIY